MTDQTPFYYIKKELKYASLFLCYHLSENFSTDKHYTLSELLPKFLVHYLVGDATAFYYQSLGPVTPPK
jgi:hypothetical protein